MEVIEDAQATFNQNIGELIVWRDLLAEETPQVVALETKMKQVQRATKDLTEELAKDQF